MPPRAAGTHLRSPTNLAGLTSRAISKASRPAATALCEAARAGFARGEEACRATSRRRTTTRGPGDRGQQGYGEPASYGQAWLRAGDQPAAKLRVGIGCRADGPLRAAAADERRVRFGAAGRPRLGPCARGLRAAEFAARPGTAGHPELAGTQPGTFGSVPRAPASAGSVHSGPASDGPRRRLPVPQAALGSGPQGAVGYGEGATGAYRQYGADDPTRSGWSDAGDQRGLQRPAGLRRRAGLR